MTAPFPGNNHAAIRDGSRPLERRARSKRDYGREVRQRTLEPDKRCRLSYGNSQRLSADPSGSHRGGKNASGRLRLRWWLGGVQHKSEKGRSRGLRHNALKSLEILERAKGFEPSTPTLARRRRGLRQGIRHPAMAIYSAINQWSSHHQIRRRYPALSCDSPPNAWNQLRSGV